MQPCGRGAGQLLAEHIVGAVSPSLDSGSRRSMNTRRGGRLVGEPGLADPARTSQRHQADIVATQANGDGCHLTLPANKGRERAGQAEVRGAMVNGRRHRMRRIDPAVGCRSSWVRMAMAVNHP